MPSLNMGEVELARRVIDWTQPKDAVVPSCPLRKIDPDRTAVACEGCTSFRGILMAEKFVPELQKPVGASRWDRAEVIRCAMLELPEALVPKHGPIQKKRIKAASKRVAESKKKGSDGGSGKNSGKGSEAD